MFDLATQPQPTPSKGVGIGLPFDWRLTAPLPASNYPFTDYSAPTGVLVVGGEVLATYALALEDGLQTAVIISLFTDSRAGRDDLLPLNQTDRRGWVGDEFMGGAQQGARADAWGSALWLVYISKVTPDVLERARFAAQEALAWLVQGGIVSRVVVTAQWAGPALDRLAIRVAIYKPQELAPVYDVLWGTTLRRLDALAQPDGAVACCEAPAFSKLAWAQQPGYSEGPFAPENVGVFNYIGDGRPESLLYFSVVGGLPAGGSIDYIGSGRTAWSYGYSASDNIGFVQMFASIYSRPLIFGLLEIRLFINGAQTGSISCAAVEGSFYGVGSFVSFVPS